MGDGCRKQIENFDLSIQAGPLAHLEKTHFVGIMALSIMVACCDCGLHCFSVEVNNLGASYYLAKSFRASRRRDAKGGGCRLRELSAGETGVWTWQRLEPGGGELVSLQPGPDRAICTILLRVDFEALLDQVGPGLVPLLCDLPPCASITRIKIKIEILTQIQLSCPELTRTLK